MQEKDLITIHYNALITVSGIPLEAHGYMVNGRTAIDCVMDRQCFKVDGGKNGGGLVSDANHWATETIGGARYPLDLLARFVKICMETTRMAKNLPKNLCQE